MSGGFNSLKPQFLVEIQQRAKHILMSILLAIQSDMDLTVDLSQSRCVVLHTLRNLTQL